jgi:DNA-binding XRE family transcriptional regulator
MAANPLDISRDAPRDLVRLPAEISALPSAFGALMKTYRVRCGLSQNKLARSAGCDPAYVNRLERAPSTTTSLPSRRFVLAFWEVFMEATTHTTRPITTDDRERLLVAAGLCPETILAAGGWDAFVGRIRRQVVIGFVSTIEQLDESLSPADL